MSTMHPNCSITRCPLTMVVLLLVHVFSNEAVSQPGFWQSLNGPEGGVVQCFTVDNNGDILAGTYFGGVYKTTNRGITWFQLPYVNLDIRALAVSSNGIIFLGAVTSGLWKSSDNGTTWVRPTNILNGRTVTSVAFHSSGNVIAACVSASSQAVFQSTDNGETFFHVSSGVLSGNSVIRQGTDMYFAGDRNGVLRSTDGGFLWSTINPSPAQFNGLSLTANASYVYVVGRKTAATNPDSAFIYRRSISSGNWELVHIQSRTILRAISSVGDTLIATGDSTVLVSFNGGQNWTTRNLVDQHRGPIALYYWARVQASFAERDFQLGGLAGQGVLRSTDFYDTWSISNEGMYNTHIVARPLLWGDKMMVSTQFNGRWRYDFTTTSWTRTGFGLPEDDVVSSLAADNMYVYAGLVNNGFWKSNDWGGTFSQNLSGTGATGFAAIYASPAIAGFVVAGGRGERVWKSTNLGGTWNSNLVPGSPYSITGITAISQNEFYVATGNFAGYGTGNGVYKTTNGGTLYTHHGLQFNNCYTLDRYNTKLLVGNSVDQVLEGDISTTAWTFTPSLGAGVKIRDLMFYNYSGQPVREIVATSVGLCEREAFSQDPWVKRVLGGFEVARIEVVRAPAGPLFTGQIIAGTYGGGVIRSTAPLTSVGENTSLPEEFSLDQNYPNPFNPTTVIDFRIKSREPISLKVFDLLGREVATLVDEVKEPGTHSVTFDASNLSSGVYFYRLQAHSIVQTRKLILLR